MSGGGAVDHPFQPLYFRMKAQLQYGEYAPARGGEIVEFNDAVDADPAIVNKDAYGEGWIVKVKMSDPAEYDALLSAADYEKLIG